MPNKTIGLCGEDDFEVLPIFNEDYTQREVVDAFRAEGHTVEYTPFMGGHEVPATISNAALDWFVGVTPEVATS